MIFVPKGPLRRVLALKGNFKTGHAPPRKMFDGIEIAPFRGACEAAASISADTELNWAFRGRTVATRDSLGRQERANIPYLLDMLSEFEIPITWAMVGHLFLDSCNKNGGPAHPEMPRPPCNERWQGDWYKHDPCTNVWQDPLWYAPDLVRQMLRANISHDIGSHSFSHIDFSKNTSNECLVRRELAASRDAMEPFGLKMKSFVYPFNHMGHDYLDVLADFGVIAVRHRDTRIRLSYPEPTNSGIYKICESMNLRSTTRYRYPDKAELFLEHAIEQTAAYHLWFHPSDPRTVFTNEFYEILQIINRFRADRRIWVTTMRDLASYAAAREALSLHLETNGATVTIFINSTLDEQRYGTPRVTLILPWTAVPKAIEQRDPSLEAILARTEVTWERKGEKTLLNIAPVSQTVAITF